MTTASQRDRSPTSTDFVEDTILEAFVPSSSKVDLQGLLEEWDGEIPEESSSVVPFIDQRQFLLLDELVPVYVVLRTKALDEESLTRFLSRLIITLEARAVGTLPLKQGEVPTTQPSQVNELLFSETIKTAEEPTICATELQPEGESDAVQLLYVFWKVTVPLGRSKSKMQKPAIYFSPVATLKPTLRLQQHAQEDDYLPSNIPAALNLLGPFQKEPALAHTKPRLSASRITKAAPIPMTVKEAGSALRNGPRRLFRAAPAFLWRVRFSKPPAPVHGNATIASLDLEITPFAGSDVSIDSMELSLLHGEVHPIGTHFPLHCRPGDQATLLYRLLPGTESGNLSRPEGGEHTLGINAAATVHISDECIPKIVISWKAAVELPTSRPRSRGSSTLLDTVTVKVPLDPDSLPMTDHIAFVENPKMVAPGVSLTISSPSRVTVGEIFRWQLFVVNRSEKTHQLAVVAMPKRRNVAERWSDAKEGFSPTGNIGEVRLGSIAASVVDAFPLLAHLQHGMMEPTDIICLSPDIRIGPLTPLACYTTRLKFVALSAGILRLDALRVIDLNTQEATDIRSLPDIVAVASEISTRSLAAAAIASPIHSFIMSFELQRRRLLRSLNSRCIYGRVPLLHALIFFLEMAAVSILTRKFNSYYASRPVLTTMITNAILGGVADTVAQSLTAIRERALRKPGGPTIKDDPLAIEIHELDRKLPYTNDLIPDSPKLPPPFDFERLTRFMAYGFLMAPVQHRWFSFLSHVFPLTKASGTAPALKRVAFDQLIFAPVGLACFFTFMTVAEGGGKRAITRKLGDVYVPALKANYMVWPAVQLVNFRLMPIQFQIPFVSTIGIAWTAYLSLTNSAEDA
ncbi:hypothetical protein EJ06DRAFT_542607 [Trichodelitschia bisporula]|uniref:Trafficking protein particle complex II-specific subunit 65 IgD3 domain-containing protein n=1 Tax=Trichodelitschia bisporula TaxID=703511 RepID=A0A6G1HZH0_9PEZI|nr:hypothetical protein EJ06DRAFT_542607 [Trichodelitschia bisporula]